MAIMKTFVIIVAVCLVAFAKAEEDFIEAAKKLEACYNEIGITQGISELTEYQEKCGIACLMKVLNIMNDGGSVNHDAILKNSNNLSAEQIDEIVKTYEAKAGDVNNKEYHCELAVCLQGNLNI